MPQIEISSEVDCAAPVPVWFSSPAVITGSLLKDADGGLTLPIQKVGNQYGVILPSVKKGERRRFSLAKGEVGPGVELKEAGEGQLSLSLPKGPFTTYHYGTGSPRPFCYPLLGPDGKRMTRSFPMEDVELEKTAKDQDHKHHRSFWTAYGEVNGSDDWSEEPNHGRILHQKFEAKWQGPVAGGFTALNRWVNKDGAPLVDEKRTLQLYAVSPEYRLLDYDVQLMATHGDVHYGDTKEGGLLAFRVYHTMKGALGGKMVNSLGAAGEKQVWGKRAAWLDYSGPLDGMVYGFGMMDHPGNLNHPCYWHARDYGLVGTNPFAKAAFEGGQKREWTQKKGETYHFRYRVLLHRGDHAAGHVEDAYHAWIQPPTVKLLG